MKYLLLGLVMLVVATTAVANNDRDAVSLRHLMLYITMRLLQTLSSILVCITTARSLLAPTHLRYGPKKRLRRMPNLTLTRAEDGHTTRETGISIFPLITM